MNVGPRCGPPAPVRLRLQKLLAPAGAIMLVCLLAAPGICGGVSSDSSKQDATQGIAPAGPAAAALNQPANAGPDSIRFYTFQDASDQTALPAPLSRFYNKHPGLAGGPHPMVQWYFWANQPQNFGRSWLFILFFSAVSWLLAPAWLNRAQAPIGGQFWKTLLTGVVVLIVLQTAARAAITTKIGWPLGIMLLGCLELALLVGLSLVVSMLGHSIGVFLRLQQWPLLSKHESVRRFTELLIGSLLFAAMLQIPGAGPLPRLGTRLVSLFAILGMGALYRQRLNAVTPPPASQA